MFPDAFRFSLLAKLLGLSTVLFAQCMVNVSHAQSISTQSGRAASVDLVAAAKDLSMQNAYARSLLSFIKLNPARFNDQQFYVGFVSYLIFTKLNDRCQDAFANEFERRDFYTRSFDILPQLQKVIAEKSIPDRFEVSYQINTGEYDFTSGSLPFDNVRSVGEQLGNTIHSGDAQSCAGNLLRGTAVDISSFPWRFNVADETGQPAAPAFPFAKSQPLSAADARTLFEQFGRQLYSIVGYQVLAAGDGTHRVQIIPTDAQLFGLSDDAVVRVQTFAHPTLSQPNYLDIANQLTVLSEPLNLAATVTLEQEGFRAVATGTSQGRGTGVTAATTHQVSGSAAVGATSFIMRMTAPQLTSDVYGLSNVPGTVRYLTMFGEIDFNNVSASKAPILGKAIVLEVDPNGILKESQLYPISGHFTALEKPGQSQVSTTQGTEAQ